jgi:hypothetical protein
LKHFKREKFFFKRENFFSYFRQEEVEVGVIVFEAWKWKFLTRFQVEVGVIVFEKLALPVIEEVWKWV